MAASDLSSTSDAPDRAAYLVECHRSGHEELMFRVSHRDNWLKIQMLAQATFLALAFGIEVGGVKATSGMPTVLALALPTALTLACLYVVEDRLIGLISRYIGRLSKLESRLTNSDAIIEYVGSSLELREYASGTLPFRVLAQCVAFALVPALLTTYSFADRFEDFSELQWYNWGELVVDSVCLIVILWLLHVAHSERKRTGQSEPPTPAKSCEPHPSPNNTINESGGVAASEIIDSHPKLGHLGRSPNRREGNHLD